MAELLERSAALLTWQGAAPPEMPQPGHWSERAGLRLLRTAPFEALAVREGAGQDVAAELGLDGVIGLSDAFLAVVLAGPEAPGRLAQLVPLDLVAWEPGRCARTLVAHMAVIVAQTGPAAWELLVGRSYAASLARAVEATFAVRPGGAV